MGKQRRLQARTVDGVVRAPERDEVRRYAVEWVENARLARKAGRDPQQIARDQFRAIGAFMATLPESERAGFDEMLAEEIEAAHAARCRQDLHPTDSV